MLAQNVAAVLAKRTRINTGFVVEASVTYGKD
jgi:hypothetical protein